MTHTNHRVVSNTVARQYLLAMREVLGKKSLNDSLRAVKLDRFIAKFPAPDLQTAMTAQEFANLVAEIENSFGDKGDEIMQRIGVAFFQLTLRDRSIPLILAGNLLSRLPEKRRVQLTLESIIEAFKKADSKADIWMEEKDGAFDYVERSCLICSGRISSQPTCHLMIGILKAAVQWTSEEPYEIVEKDCIAGGKPYCRFTVKHK
jgi:predicted hydrocarbon binding protein